MWGNLIKHCWTECWAFLSSGSTDVPWRDAELLPWAPKKSDYHNNNKNNRYCLFETKALCVRNGKAWRQRWSSPGCCSVFSLSQFVSSFAFSGSNLAGLIIKASTSCCCRVNHEVKCAPKNSIFTQVDQHNKEHAVDAGRLLSCQIKCMRGSLSETDNKQLCLCGFCCGWPSQHARWAALWHNVDPLWVNTYQLILWSFILTHRFILSTLQCL